MKVSLLKERYCGPCGETHPINAFNQRYMKGRRSISFYCKKQTQILNTRRNERSRMNRRNGKLKDWRRENPAGSMLLEARRRARRRGIPFTLNISDIMIPTYCPLLGIELQPSPNSPGPGSPSLDRIDPALGYVPGNVWVISTKANRMKNDATPEELRRFAQEVLKRFDADISVKKIEVCGDEG